jgi:YD repeat-containing protein
MGTGAKLVIPTKAFATARTGARAGSAPSVLPSTPTWNDWVAAKLDPVNRTGSTDPFSRNFHWNLGLAGLPGRAGLDAGLTLHYNSLIWTKDPSGAYVGFDLDRGFPTPGFRLGFPVIYGPHANGMAGANAFLMITPEGDQVELRQVGSTAVYEAADSSHVQLTVNNADSLTVRTTDGTALAYVNTGNGFRCSQIKDRNGNYVTVSHDGKGRLQNVTDTLNRVLTLHYDEHSNPISITQSRGGSDYIWATFGYADLRIAPHFDGPAIYGVDSDEMLPVLNRVGLPDGSYYLFDYTDYAQVAKISYYAADDHLLNYLANDLSETSSSAQTDCPRIGQIKVWEENWTFDPESTSEPHAAVTILYAPVPADCDRSGSDNDCEETVVTTPDGTQQHTLTRVAGAWDYGLPVLEETWGDDQSTAPTPHLVKQRWVATIWSQDNTGLAYPLNPRVTDLSIFDGSNQKRTAIGYRSLAIGCGTGCSTDFHLPNSLAEYDANATTVLRTTQTDYLETTGYLDRRIIGLPVEKRVYAGTSSGTLMAKTGLYYDEAGFLTAQGSSIPQFDVTNFGSASLHSTLARREGRSNIRRTERCLLSKRRN